MVDFRFRRTRSTGECRLLLQFYKKRTWFESRIGTANLPEHLSGFQYKFINQLEIIYFTIEKQ